MLMFTYTYCHLTYSIAIILLAGNSFFKWKLEQFWEDFYNPLCLFFSCPYFQLVRCQLSSCKTTVGGLWVPAIFSTVIRHIYSSTADSYLLVSINFIFITRLLEIFFFNLSSTVIFLTTSWLYIRTTLESYKILRPRRHPQIMDFWKWGQGINSNIQSG